MSTVRLQREMSCDEAATGLGFKEGDVIAPLLVQDAHERGEGGRLPAVGRPGQQHQPLVEVGEPRERVGQAQLVEGGGPRRDVAEDGVRAPLLAEDVQAELNLSYYGMEERMLSWQ